MFPVTDDSQTIIDCFLHEAQIKKIQIVKQARVNELHPEKSGFTLVFNESKQHRSVYYKFGIITLLRTWITPLPA